MLAEDRNGPRFAFIPVPWFPGLFRLSTTVLKAAVNTKAGARTGLVGMRYDAWDLADPQAIDQGCGGYIFSEATNSVHDSENWMQFIWNPPISDELKAVPFLEFNSPEPHPWPDVVRSVNFLSNFGAGAGPQPYASVQRKPGGSISSKIVESHYISDEPFSDHDCRTDEPLPGVASWSFVDSNGFDVEGSLSECLHPTLVFPQRARLVWDASPTTPDPILGTRKTVFATNHTDWKKHVIGNKVIEDNGLYHRIQRTVYPPKKQPIWVIT